MKKVVISKEEIKVKGLLDNIKKGSPTIFQDVVLLVSKQAYLTLDYTTAKQCLIVYKPDLSLSYISLLLSAAKIYYKVDPGFLYLDKVSESLFRPLHHASDDYAKAVWNTLVASFDNTRKCIKAIDMKNAIYAETNRALCPLQIDDKTKKSIIQCAKKVCKDKLFTHFKTHAEWLNVASLIYRQLQLECPHGETSFESAPVKKEVL